MIEWFRHFPTFVRAWRWYRGRDSFERALITLALLGVFGYILYVPAISPPPEFPSGAYVPIRAGETLRASAKSFESRGIVRSATLFAFISRTLGNDKRISAGTYYFPSPQNLIQVAIRVTSGDFGTTLAKVTVPEGATVNDISKLLLEKLPDFDRQKFLAAARGQEGYLFPDTYFFMPGDGAEQILSIFNNGFFAHRAKIQKQIDAFKKPLSEVVTMASLLEKEANDMNSRRVIAGILWRRIEIGMPLQVDAVFPYIIGKNSFQLTTEDLQIDNPYNTYKYKGLPPGPIANPGLDSLTAAVTPIKSNYLYYLSDKQGNFHFAATYQQFLVYKHRYLGS